jgi:hypothetical protein
MGERRCRKALSSPISCSCVRDKADAAFLLCSAPHDERCSLSQYSMRARKNFSYRALLSLQSAPILRKGKRPSLNLGDDTNFFAQFECAPLSSIIRRGVHLLVLFFSSRAGKYRHCCLKSPKSVRENAMRLQTRRQPGPHHLLSSTTSLWNSTMQVMIAILFYFIT